jgi:hypothetical protein
MTTGYCMKCKAKKEMDKVVFVTTKTGNKAAKGQCKKCGTNMYAMLPKDSSSVKSKSKKSKKSSKSKKSKKGGKSKKSKKSKKSRKSRK